MPHCSNSNSIPLATFTTSKKCDYHRGNALTIYDLGLMHDGGRVLFQAADCSFTHGYITGLVGTNGAGKTSLANILAAKALDGFPSDLTVEYLAAADDEDNHDPLCKSLEKSPRDYIQSRLQERLDVLRRNIEDLERSMEEGDPVAVEQIAEELSDLYEVEESMTERMEREADQAMEQVGLIAHAHKMLGQLSCGWRYKCRLIAAVLTHPDFLIVDEPSFLDENSKEWLVEQLKRMAKDDNSIILLISHKEILLEALCDRIIHINSANQTLTTYNCSYSNFRATLDSTIENATKTIQQTEDHLKVADKALKKVQAVCKKREQNFSKATSQGEDKRFIRGKNKESKQKADKSAASRLHKAQHAVAEAQEIKHKAKRERVKPLQIVGIPAEGTLVSLQSVGFRHELEDDWIFQNVDTSLDAKDRVLLHGANGCGKTTLVQLILGELEPREGSIQRSTQNVLYFPQTALHQLIRQNGHLTALEFLNRGGPRSLTETQARHHLGDLGLAKDLALSRVATLSAGQRVRLWLAQQLLHHPKPSLLILDEVSENVDVDTRQSLAELLESFDGAALVISHDPDFVETAKFTKIWKLWRYGMETTYSDTRNRAN